MNRTKIEWTDYTWNPITGCKNRCTYCYARKIPTRFKGTKAFLYGFEPTFHLSRLKEPYRVKKPSKIFVCSMGEMFGNWVPINWQYRVQEVIRDNPRHIFQILTKFPQGIFFHLGSLKNCWMGVTITTQKTIYKLDRLYENTFASRLSLCPVRFALFEPLLSKVQVSLSGFDWIIIGAQTNPYRPPQKEWVDAIVKEADGYKIPVFLKNNLEPILGENLRQEFPNE